MEDRPLITETDKRVIKRAVYGFKSAMMQGVALRIRCVTVAPADVASAFAEGFFLDSKLGDSIQFLSWDDDRWKFAGHTKDLIILSGFGDSGRIAECWARLRDPVEGTDFEKWGRSLEIVA